MNLNTEPAVHVLRCAGFNFDLLAAVYGSSVILTFANSLFEFFRSLAPKAKCMLGKRYLH